MVVVVVVAGTAVVSRLAAARVVTVLVGVVVGRLVAVVEAALAVVLV